MQLDLIPAATSKYYQSQESWLKARKLSIGSSESAAILGVNTWKSPYSVWYDKTSDGVEESEPDETAEWGHRLEHSISKKFQDIYGCQLYDPGEYAIYTSTEYPWLSCTPDRLWHAGGGLRAVVELKTAHFAQGKIWGERVPESYMVQVQHQMIVLGCDEAYIAVLVDGYKFAHHPVLPHTRMQNLIIGKTKHFWESFVQTGTAPPPDYSAATRQAIHARYPTSSPGIVDIADDRLGERYDKLCRIGSKVDSAKQLIQNQIKDAIGQQEVARLPDLSGFSWKESKNGRRTFRRVERVYSDDYEG